MTAIRTLDRKGADLAPLGGNYSHACLGNGLVFVAGQLPIRPDGQGLVDSRFAQQPAQALANVEAALRNMGSDIGRLLQVRVYVDDTGNWSQ